MRIDSNEGRAGSGTGVADEAGVVWVVVTAEELIEAVGARERTGGSSESICMGSAWERLPWWEMVLTGAKEGVGEDWAWEFSRRLFDVGNWASSMDE